MTREAVSTVSGATRTFRNCSLGRWCLNQIGWGFRSLGTCPPHRPRLKSPPIWSRNLYCQWCKHESNFAGTCNVDKAWSRLKKEWPKNNNHTKNNQGEYNGSAAVEQPQNTRQIQLTPHYWCNHCRRPPLRAAAECHQTTPPQHWPTCTRHTAPPRKGGRCRQRIGRWRSRQCEWSEIHWSSEEEGPHAIWPNIVWSSNNRCINFPTLVGCWWQCRRILVCVQIQSIQTTQNSPPNNWSVLPPRTWKKRSGKNISSGRK